MHDTLLERNRTKLYVKIGVWLVIAVLSLTVIRHFVVSVDTYRSIIESLDSKKTTVFSLITASTAVSAAITLIPGDVGTPIAQQIAELSEYFIVVLGALYLEKYLLTILGFVSSVILVPGSCALSIAHELRPGSGWKKRLAITLLVVGLAGVLVVPASVAVSNSIGNTFHESIQSTVDSVMDLSGQLEDETESNPSLWESLSNAAQSVTSGVSGALENAKAAVNHIIESIVIMLVTDCVIPIAVVLFFVWMVKQIVKALYSHPSQPLPPPEDELPRRSRWE